MLISADFFLFPSLPFYMWSQPLWQSNYCSLSLISHLMDFWSYSLSGFCCMKVTFSTCLWRCGLRPPFDTVGSSYGRLPGITSARVHAHTCTPSTLTTALQSAFSTSCQNLKTADWRTRSPPLRPYAPNPRTTTEKVLSASPNLRSQSRTFRASRQFPWRWRGACRGGGSADCRCGRGSKHAAECQPKNGKEKREEKKKKKKKPRMRREGVSMELVRDCNYTTCQVSL